MGSSSTRASVRSEDDRRKDAKLQIAGCRVVRFTYARVFREPRSLARDLDRLLAT
jgi:very-short-patch-repair endonuclease